MWNLQTNKLQWNKREIEWDGTTKETLTNKTNLCESGKNPVEKLFDIVPLDVDNQEYNGAENKEIVSNESENNNNSFDTATTTVQRLIHHYKNNEPSLGNIPNFNHTISISEPLTMKSKPYQLPIKVIEPMKNKVRELIRQEIIEPSTSNFSSPAFPILKADGSLRIVNNFIELNKVSEVDQFPLPVPENIILKLKENTVYSTLDLSQGFYQINLAPES